MDYTNTIIVSVCLALIFVFIIKPRRDKKAAEEKKRLEEKDTPREEKGETVSQEQAPSAGADAEVNARQGGLREVENPALLFSLAMSFFNSHSFEDAVRYFRMAVNKGSVEAMNMLGVCYENGYGVSKEDDLAQKYYTEAAEKGCVEAQFNLGRFFYLLGESRHYTKVGNMSVRIGPAPLEPYEEDVQALKWFRKAAEQGNLKAQYSLGQCLIEGHGIQTTAAVLEEGKEWMSKAAENGFQPAKDYLAANKL